MSKLKIKHAAQTPDSEKCRMLILNKGYFALVDKEDYEWLSAWSWKVKQSAQCIYAVHSHIQNGKEHLFRMHRLVANTPADQQTHHINHDTLDNRKCNLKNVTPEEHAKFL